MNRTALPLLIASVFLLIPAHATPLQAPNPGGILVRPQDSIQTEEDIDSIINLCEKYNITTVFLMVKQDTGTESGQVYYNSAKITRISDFDLLALTLQKARRKNIKVYAWIPLLYDKEASGTEIGGRTPGIGNNWVSPSESLPYYSAMVEEIMLYNVDGILFDYLRFSDDFAASDQMKATFGQKYGYNMDSVELSVEKERDSQLWHQWMLYRNQALTDFLTALRPKTIPVGVTALPEDLAYINSASNPFTNVDFVSARTEENPTPLINTLALSTNASIYVILPNSYVSQTRHRIAESFYADFLIFDSDSWDEHDFQRIKKAEKSIDDIRMTSLTFIDFFNNRYNMETLRSYTVDAMALPAGHVYWTYFRYLPYTEKWSAYTLKYNRDFMEEMVAETQKTGMYPVLSVDIQSEEYVTKHKEAASTSYLGVVLRTRVCMTALQADYKNEVFDMTRYLADNYEGEAILITNISYLEDCFCPVCLKSYSDFMAQKGMTVGDWPRVNGQIDLYDTTVREWKTAQITSFLLALKEYLRDANKEFWVEVPVSGELEYQSAEYGLYLPEVEKIADRIVLVNVDITNTERAGRIAAGLSRPEKYILCFPITTGTPPTRTVFLDSLKAVYENGVASTGVYPHAALTETLGAAFYIGYAYRLALADEGLMQVYNLGDYGGVISTYAMVTEEKKEEERLTRERARQNIREAERSYLDVLASLDEARQVNLNVAALEATIQTELDLLEEAKSLFMTGNYEQAEEEGKTCIIEFSTLNMRISKAVGDERIKRVTSGVLLVVVFLLIMMYIRFTMGRHRHT